MDLAHLKVISGAFSYNDAIYAAVKSLADKGIARVEYPSGRRDNADVCVRRAVLSSVNKSCCDIQLDLANEVGSRYVEVSSHFGARPSHAEWQGQIYSLVKGDPKYPYFYDATGYGTGEGLGGWNCRHNFFPYFEGIDTPYHTPDFTKTENNEYYALTQKQRAYERAVRDSKRQLAALDGARQSAEDPQLRARLDSDFARRSVTLKNREARLDAFIRDNDLQRDNARVRVVGFGKSVSQKAVHSGNSSYLKYMKQLGIENPPKTIALFNQMMYNNTPEYQMLNAYMTSVKSGMLSPLAGFDKYNEYYNRVQNEIIGIKTATGVEIKSQSKHFLERVFGTPNDPTHENRSRSGVKLEDIIDALKNGKPKQNPKDNTSVSFVTDKCSVAVNIKTGKLIQVNPK